MKKIIVAFTMLLTLALQSQELTPTEFIDVAGKQRMLSQKIAKDYLIISYAEYDKAFELSSKVKIDYKVARSVFKRNLEMLFNNTDIDKKILKLLKEESDTWEALKKEIDKEKTAERAVKCVELANVLLEKSNNVVLEAQRRFSTSGSEKKDLLNIINKSGKQRMLSQRLCLLFMNQKMQKFLDKKKRGKLYSIDEVFDKMDTDIGDLLVSKYNTLAKTDGNIGEISVEFDVLKDKKEIFINGHLTATEVFEVTNNLTSLFNELTFKYSKIH